MNQSPSNFNQNTSFNNNYSNSQQTNKKNSKNIIIIILVLIIILLSIILIINRGKNKEVTNYNNNNSVNNNNDDNNSNDIVSDIEYDKNDTFLMRIDEIFTVTGRGTIATGRVERGSAKVNDTILLIGTNNEMITTTIAGMEVFRESIDSVKKGDNVGILLKNISKEQINNDYVITKSKSIKATKKFDAILEIFATDEGGRTEPFFEDYTPNVSFGVLSDVLKGKVIFPKGLTSVSPGDKDVKLTVELESSILMDPGTEFKLHDDKITIGRGIVTKIY